jgi:hypothetical protein
VRDQSVKDVMRILPDRFGNDQSRLGIDRVENLHALFLGADEAVLLHSVHGMGSSQLETACVDCLRQTRFHFGLGRPTNLIGGQAEITVGD